MEDSSKFGRYKILESLASGGMAQIFKAETSQGKVLTLKKILKEFSNNPDFIRMFLDEAKITLNLKHKNVIRVVDFGQLDGVYYLAMEYIFGKDVATLLRVSAERKIHIPIDVACNIAMQCCQGLEYAHSQTDGFGRSLGIVHRDISPPNILVGYNGETKILDFGIAKVAKTAGNRLNTRSGVLKGKFSYMSPEQAYGENLNHQSDIFSVGIVLYELLTSRSLFYSDDEIETLERVRRAKIKPPSAYRTDIPYDLENIVLKALSLKLTKRYSTAAEMASDLRKFLKKFAPRSDARQVARFLRQSFPEDFRKRIQTAFSEGWKDELELGGSDEELLLDQGFGQNTLTSTRIQPDHIPWYQRLFYDPKMRQNRQRLFFQLVMLLGLISVSVITYKWKDSILAFVRSHGSSFVEKNEKTSADSVTGGFAHYQLEAEKAAASEAFDYALENDLQALEINSFETKTLIHKAFMELALGDSLEACTWFQAHKELVPPSDALLSEGLCSEWKGEIPRAAQAYSDFLEKFKQDPRATKVENSLRSLRKRRNL